MLFSPGRFARSKADVKRIIMTILQSCVYIFLECLLSLIYLSDRRTINFRSRKLSFMKRNEADLILKNIALWNA